ncbi:protein of unknown function [Rhodovastum atsumiense]|nr:protein of unknown function [Rhodovastum atsumiense]
MENPKPVQIVVTIIGGINFFQNQYFVLLFC